MQDITCILCGKPSDYIAITENGYTGRKCPDCRLIFISPRPSADDVTQLYTDDHAVLYADAQFLFEGFKRKVAASTLGRINKYKNSGSILELGPGAGFFLKEARDWGYEPFGIELNPIEAQWIAERMNIPCENVALHEGSFGGRQFDIIYHNDVLSHLYEPIGVFKDINRALKGDGLLAFETGNIADVGEKYYKYYSQFLYPDHLFFYGESSLKRLLDQTGFECVKIYRQAVILQLILQKALWGLKDLLKDKQVIDAMKTEKRLGQDGQGLSLKRQLRLLYRYASYYLVRAGGTLLPKEGRPLKLLVVARKKTDI